LDHIRTESHKYMKGLEKIYRQPMTELQQYEYDAASQRFCDLIGAFKGMHRLKYAQYFERIEVGLKSNPRGFFKFTNLKRNSSGYPSRNAQEIANLFGEYFQGVYVMDDSWEDFVVDDGVENSSTVSLIQLEEKL
jgi:hypothetical protein